MPHTCHAVACRKPVPPAMFMCRSHWYSIPKPDRDKVWDLYRAGQENDKRPSHEYLRATNRMIIELAEKEGHTEHPDYRLALKRRDIFNDLD
jgi:hypothetical protein